MHVPVADGLVGRHLAIRLDAVLQTEKLPAPGPKTSYTPMISRKSHGKKVPKSRKRTMTKGVPVENK